MKASVFPPMSKRNYYTTLSSFSLLLVLELTVALGDMMCPLKGQACVMEYFYF
jgi:hypothetical protein